MISRSTSSIAGSRHSSAKRFKDFRKLFDEAHKDFDAVIIATPDHTHAVIGMAAMQLGKHVYVQKPMTHTVAEARLLTLTAREMKVATQLGNQGHSGDGARQMCEIDRKSTRLNSSH